MPLFEIRREAQDDSGHYQLTTLQADSAEAAQAWAEENEREFVEFTLDPAKAAEILDGRPESSIDDLPTDPAEIRAQFSGAKRAWLLAHLKTEPHKIVSIVELDPETKQPIKKGGK